MLESFTYHIIYVISKHTQSYLKNSTRDRKLESLHFFVLLLYKNVVMLVFDVLS